MDHLFALVSPFSSAYASSACTVYSSSLLNAGETLYSNCSFSGSSAVWNGGVTFTGTAGSTVTRVIATGTTRTAASGTVVTINSTGSSTALTPFSGSGGSALTSGGSTATFTSGTMTGVAINGVNFVTSGYNHLLTTTGGSALSYNSSTSTWTGTIILYHQLAKVVATSVVDVTMSSGCCLPTGGTIKTTFSVASSSSNYSKYNGQTETLSFTGCGTASYTGPESYSGSSVTLSHCL
jgi:hypothetical protein